MIKTDGTLAEIQNNTIQPSDLNQNYNAFALNMVYTWQIANGSFLNIVWKDEADDFAFGNFENNYQRNFERTFDNNNINSISARLIYFIDYATVVKKRKKVES
jgi:hypothetical protein